jgi:hypothetical protein
VFTPSLTIKIDQSQPLARDITRMIEIGVANKGTYEGIFRKKKITIQIHDFQKFEHQTLSIRNSMLTHGLARFYQ